MFFVRAGVAPAHRLYLECYAVGAANGRVRRQIAESAEGDLPLIAESVGFALGRSQPAAVARANGAERQERSNFFRDLR